MAPPAGPLPRGEVCVKRPKLRHLAFVSPKPQLWEEIIPAAGGGERGAFKSREGGEEKGERGVLVHGKG